MKICKKCGEEKNESEFNKSKQSKDGLNNKCKECDNKERKIYRDNNIEKVREYKKKYYNKNKIIILESYKKKIEENKEHYLLRCKKNREKIKTSEKIIIYSKVCTICKNNKDINDFNKCNSNKDGFNYVCRECQKIQIKKWRDNNPTYEKSKRQNDILFRLKGVVRHRIGIFLKSSNIKKRIKSSIMLGCTTEELIIYLQNKFTDGMKWENYGRNGWHIDHIIPLSSAKTEEEIYKLCHYTNLQPLWWIDNLRKGNKIL